MLNYSVLILHSTLILPNPTLASMFEVVFQKIFQKSNIVYN